MQQLTILQFIERCCLQSAYIEVDISVPQFEDLLEWKDLIEGWFNSSVKLEQGADRAQFFFDINDFSCVLIIEWLCESMWLEVLCEKSSTASNKTQALWNELVSIAVKE